MFFDNNLESRRTSHAGYCCFCISDANLRQILIDNYLFKMSFGHCSQDTPTLRLRIRMSSLKYSSKGKVRSAASSSSNAAAGVAPKRRNGPRSCRSISNQERGSSASIPQDEPILQDEIPERWDEIDERIQDEIPELVSVLLVYDGQGNRKKTRLKLKHVIPSKIGFKVLTQWNARGQGI